MISVSVVLERGSSIPCVYGIVKTISILLSSRDARGLVWRSRYCILSRLLWHAIRGAVCLDVVRHGIIRDMRKLIKVLATI